MFVDKIHDKSEVKVLKALNRSCKDSRMKLRYQVILLYLEGKSRNNIYTAKSIVKNDQDAEDVLQAAFIRIAKNLDKIQDINCSKTKNFLVRIVRNKAIDCYNESVKQPKMVEFDESVACDPQMDSVSSDIHFAETKEFILSLIKELPENYQTVLLYRVLYEWSYKEIADFMGVTDKNISTMLTRARRKLIKLFNESL